MCLSSDVADCPGAEGSQQYLAQFWEAYERWCKARAAQALTTISAEMQTLVSGGLADTSLSRTTASLRMALTAAGCVAPTLARLLLDVAESTLMVL